MIADDESTGCGGATGPMVSGWVVLLLLWADTAATYSTHPTNIRGKRPKEGTRQPVNSIVSLGATATAVFII